MTNTPTLTDMLGSMLPLTEASLTVLKNIMNTAEAPLKNIAEHLLHINGIYLKEDVVSDEISKLSDEISKLNKRSNSLRDDKRRKINIMMNEIKSANLKEKAMAAILTTNWEFLTVAGTTPKVDIVTWYIKKRFASHDKLYKQEVESIGKTVEIDTKPIVKILKDKSILIFKKSYTCPECGSTMLPSDSRSIECDDCGEEYGSKHDLDREIWYEKGPNFYASPLVAKPIAEQKPIVSPQSKQSICICGHIITSHYHDWEANPGACIECKSGTCTKFVKTSEQPASARDLSQSISIHDVMSAQHQPVSDPNLLINGGGQLVKQPEPKCDLCNNVGEIERNFHDQEIYTETCPKCGRKSKARTGDVHDGLDHARDIDKVRALLGDKTATEFEKQQTSSQ